jgi:hypothetical protein
MNKTYHPKYGVRYMSDYVKITVEKPGEDGAVEAIPVSTENDLPLCKEVVRTLYIPIKTKEGLTDYIPMEKDHLIELLAYARSIEEKEPVYASADLTTEDIKNSLSAFRRASFIGNLPKPWESL